MLFAGRVVIEITHHVDHFSGDFFPSLSAELFFIAGAAVIVIRGDSDR
jgi:hypothetical protein